MWKPGKLDIVHRQGSTFDPTWTLRDQATGNPRDLTSWTARMKLRDGPDGAEVISLTTGGGGITLGGALGTIAPVITAAASTALIFPGASKSYDWDLELVEPGGAVRAVVYGSFTFSREMTR